MVYRQFEEMDEGVRKFRKQLLRFIVDETVVSAWPGTMLYNASAVLGRYCLERGSVEILKQVADGLYDWGRFGSGMADEVRLPEDLCLMRPDGTPWLVTIGHEEAGYFRVTEQERGSLLEAIPDLGRLLE